MPIVRTAWGNFPNVIVQSTASALTAHPDYAAASRGDFTAARAIARDLVRPELFPWRPNYITPVIRQEPDRSWNPLSVALAERLSLLTGAKVVATVYQENVPASAGVSVHSLLAQPAFAGSVPKGTHLIVDDNVSFGSSLANLRGYLESKGASVAAASTFCSELFASKLRPDPASLSSIQKRFHHELPIIPETLGFGSECLTNRECLFLYGLKTLIALRDPSIAQHRSIKPSL